MHLTEAKLNLAILVSAFRNEKSAVGEIVDDPFGLTVITGIQEGLDGLPLLRIEYADGARVVVPHDVSAVFSRGSEVVPGGDPLQFFCWRFDFGPDPLVRLQASRVGTVFLCLFWW